MRVRDSRPSRPAPGPLNSTDSTFSQPSGTVRSSCRPVIRTPITFVAHAKTRPGSSSVTVHTRVESPGCVSRARPPTARGTGSRGSALVMVGVASGRPTMSVVTSHTTSTGAWITARS